MCLQESLLGVSEPAGEKPGRGPAAHPRRGRPRDAGPARGAASSAAALRHTRGALQEGPYRGVFTRALLAGCTTWSTWRGWRAPLTPSPSWT